ncbi:hypothetical protein FA13DRAFT_1718315 [Coprinellus micaceus]|uniref:Uncharacterized protein n=1 Tax=Coprinellus micaceus TaxID=71717 RepID=A0A4Y7SFN5_COPMI|nr:hypothetical protein FA13DRAFT_1718315 [Coprinellus micaceus]
MNQLFLTLPASDYLWGWRSRGHRIQKREITTTTRNNWNEECVPGTTTQAVHVDGPSDPYTVATTAPRPYLDESTPSNVSPPLIQITFEDSLHVFALPIARLPSRKGEKLMGEEDGAAYDGGEEPRHASGCFDPNSESAFGAAFDSTLGFETAQTVLLLLMAMLSTCSVTPGKLGRDFHLSCLVPSVRCNRRTPKIETVPTVLPTSPNSKRQPNVSIPKASTPSCNALEPAIGYDEVPWRDGRFDYKSNQRSVGTRGRRYPFKDWCLELRSPEVEHKLFRRSFAATSRLGYGHPAPHRPANGLQYSRYKPARLDPHALPPGAWPPSPGPSFHLQWSLTGPFEVHGDNAGIFETAVTRTGHAISPGR